MEKHCRDKFLYWRQRVFFSIFISWATFHFVRKSFSAVIPWMKADLGFSVVEIGFLSTAFYAFYSFSKLFCGYISDSSNARYILSGNLIVTGLMNIVFGASSSLPIMMICLVVSSIAQAFSWPACTKLLTFWCSNKERGKWWGLCGVGQNLGAGLIPVFAGVVAVYLSWRWAMYLSGVISLVIAGVLVFTVRDKPSSVGLDPILRSPSEKANEKTCDKKNSFLSVMKKYIFTNVPFLIFSASGLFLYIVRSAVNDWMPLFLIESRGYENMIVANSTISWFEIGGLLGGVVSCWASDVIFKADRIRTNIFLASFLFICVGVFYFVPPNHIIMDSFFMGVIGFLLFGFQGVFGLTTAEMVSHSYAGTANSFGGFVCNIGAAISGLPLAVIIKDYGWDTFFESIILCSFLTLVLVVLAQKLLFRGKKVPYA